MSNLNPYASHPLQTLEWGEFRKKTGVKVILGNNFQLTIHKIPRLPFTISYLPKGPLPTRKMIDELIEIGKRENCIFIQIEPNVTNQQISNSKLQINSRRKNLNKTVSHFENSDLFDAWNLSFGTYRLMPATHPLFTKYTFQLDLTKSEDELLKNMHPKTRYNIKVAQKHGVTVLEDNSDEAFKTYLKLTQETTKRQGFYAHNERYHKLLWQTLKIVNHKSLILNHNKLSAHLLIASYSPKPYTLNPIPLVAWVLFVFKDTLYYPYGASSSEHRETMASNLMMWEAIKFGKKLGLKKFDMWGALGPNPDPKDPWFGFHRFKLGYGPKHVEFVGSYDLVIKPFLYQLYVFADKFRWAYLRIKKGL